MESLEARFRNLRELVGRQIGTRTKFDEKIFGSSHGVAGEMSNIATLPTEIQGPVLDLETGEFYFMADYDYLDGGGPIG